MRANRLKVGMLFAPVLACAGFTASAIEFEDVTAAAGVEHPGEGNLGESFGASWGDLDGDGFPDLFVSNHRSMPSLFLNRGDGTFVDVADQTSIWVLRQRADTHGAAWFDYNNDGSQDLFVSVGVGNSDQFLVNERGALVERSEALGLGAGVSDHWGSRLPVWMDYDGDGRPDFVMATMIVRDESGREVNAVSQVMRQVSDGTFVLETANIGVSCARQQYLQLLDVSGDGRLELVCPDGANYPDKVYNTLPSPWDDRTSLFPLSVEGGPDSVIADFFNNGRPSIFHLSGQQLRPSGVAMGSDRRSIEALLMGGTKGFNFTSSGSATFELDWNVLDEDGDSTGIGLTQIRYGAAGASPTGIPFTLNPADTAVHGMPPDDPSVTPLLLIGYDPDTQLWRVSLRTLNSENERVFSSTYFQVTTTADISDLTPVGLSFNDGPARPTMLKNEGGGNFIDSTEASGFTEDLYCVSATAGDFDNDMWIDLYLACRTPTGNIENILYRNVGDGNFERVPGAGGAAGPVGLAIADDAGTADTVVSADYDGDGFLDLFVTNGFNMRPLGRGGPNNLYRNRGNDNNWVQLDLVGVQTHREAIGTQVTATANGIDQTRIKNGSYHRWSHDHTRMHFGLADAEAVDLRITWPSGTVDNHDGVPAGSVYRAIEGGDLEVVTLGDGLPYPCGNTARFLEPATDRGVFLSQECRTGRWELRAARGEGEITSVTGRIVSTSPMGNVRARGIEPQQDTLLCDGEACPDTSGGTSASEIVIEFQVRGGTDGVDFTPQRGANTCVTIDEGAGAEVFLGPFKRQVSNQFYLDTLEPCPGGIPEEPQEVPPPGNGPGDDDDNGGPDDGDDGNGGPDDGDDGNGGPGDGDDNGSDNNGGGGGALGVPWLIALIGTAAWYRRAAARRPVPGRSGNGPT